jgi:hypothetical protein
LSLPHHQLAPADILPAGHHPIHQIVPLGNASEHSIHVLFFFGGGVERHAKNFSQPTLKVNLRPFQQKSSQ